MASAEHSKLFSMFLGPKGENTELLKELLSYGINRHQQWRSNYAIEDPSLYPEHPDDGSDKSELRSAVDALLSRLEENIPFFHPRYSAQMLKDPAIPAVLGYVLTMLINPNNHAYEGGPPTTQMELESVDALMKLVGFDRGWGHLTSGGSLANLEALWAVRDTYRKGKVFFSVGSHLSWKRICNILNIDDYEEVPVDRHYRMDLDYLESALKKGKTMMVMANFGTTGCGAVDSIADLLELKEKFGFHLHVDAAYGGYAKALLYDENGTLLPYGQVNPIVSKYLYAQAVALSQADSVTIDPHKHGLMPYGAGSVLFRHEKLRQAILNTAPYTYHVKDKPNIGTFTLEGSRPGAAAAGVWLTQKMFPLHRSGIGLLLEQTLKTAQELHRLIQSSYSLVPVTYPDLDILCFFRADHSAAPKFSAINANTLKIYKKLSVENPDAPFILSKFIIDKNSAQRILPRAEPDEDMLIAMRAVFIKHWMLLDKENSYVGKLYNEVERIT